MTSTFTGLPGGDARRPQRGDEVQFAGGGTYGWVVDAKQDLIKVRVGSSVKWLPFSVIEGPAVGSGHPEL